MCDAFRVEARSSDRFSSCQSAVLHTNGHDQTWEDLPMCRLSRDTNHENVMAAVFEVQRMCSGRGKVG